MKIILDYQCLFWLFLFGFNSIQAQSPEMNLEKYWNYRERLIGKAGHAGFVDVGEGIGRSIPASERHLYADCKYDWYLNNNFCQTRVGQGRMHWGDCSLYQGFYMMILALEYVNLERANQPTGEVAEELWYALQAVERLDSMAEVALGKEGKLDGFFIRDDVMGDFYLKRDAPKKRRFGVDSLCIDCISSAMGCGEPSAEDGSFLSQDQVIGLFLGFSTIHHLIADKRYKKDGPTFGEKVALLTHRIANYMMTNKWKLVDPDGNKIPDKWGGNAIGMSYPIAKIANEITGKKYHKNYVKKGALWLGLPIYDLLQLSMGFQHKTNVILGMMSMTMLPKRGHRALGRKGRKHDAIVYPLIRAVVFGDQLFKKIKQRDFEALMNAAPFDGPCFGTKDCEAPDGWKSYDRWLHPQFKNGNPYGVKSEFPGLDYMMLYNLYHYYYKDKLPPYQTGAAHPMQKR